MAIHEKRHKIGTLVALPMLVLAAACGGISSSAADGAAQQGQQPTAIEQASTPATQASPTNAPTAIAIAPTPLSTAWVPPTALVRTPIPGAEATLTAAPQLKQETLVFTNSVGENYNMTVEVADTPATQELGLMFRASVPPDAGMLFDFGGDTTEGFWMANTILPLSIAFIQGDGAILDIRDMQPLDRSTTSASGPYHYALETNQGYFAAHNIQKGDHVLIPGAQGLVIPGMPSCAR